jgi:hypothetical protein
MGDYLKKVGDIFVSFDFLGDLFLGDIYVGDICGRYLLISNDNIILIVNIGCQLHCKVRDFNIIQFCMVFATTLEIIHHHHFHHDCEIRI